MCALQYLVCDLWLIDTRVADVDSAPQQSPPARQSGRLLQMPHAEYPHHHDGFQRRWGTGENAVERLRPDQKARPVATPDGLERLTQRPTRAAAPAASPAAVPRRP
jgi:hypothetical protein